MVKTNNPGDKRLALIKPFDFMSKQSRSKS
jgi:hypothetical protein